MIDATALFMFAVSNAAPEHAEHELRFVWVVKSFDPEVVPSNPRPATCDLTAGVDSLSSPLTLQRRYLCGESGREQDVVLLPFASADPEGAKSLFRRHFLLAFLLHRVDL